MITLQVISWYTTYTIPNILSTRGKATTQHYELEVIVESCLMSANLIIYITQ